MIFDKLFKRLTYKPIPTHPKYGISKNGEVCNLETGYILKPLMGRSDKARVKLDGKFELISDLIDISYKKK